jgi:tRNA(fMet)-specific endonuclease VapC
MEASFLGLVLDTSILITAERLRLTPAQTVRRLLGMVGEMPIVLSAMSVAEFGHGIYRAGSMEFRERRRAFLDELKATVPVYPVTVLTAELMARVGSEQAAKGITLRLLI